MPPMNEDEIREFLRHGTRTGKLATTRRDGRPHVTPIWFVVDGDDIVFTTGTASVKGKTLRRDPRAALCVDDDVPPFSYVLIEGTAHISEDVDDLRTWATRLGARYMGEERAEEFGARNAVPGELLVRLVPTRKTGEHRVAD